MPKRTTNRRTSNLDEEIGARVRMQRLAKGLSQSDLGHRIGVTFQQVQKYEKASNRIGAGQLQKIATTLGVPVAVFFQSLDSANGQAIAPGGLNARMLQDRNTIQLVRAFQTLGPTAQRRVIDLVNHMAGDEK